MRMRTMAEAELKTNKEEDRLECEFRELETKLVEKIKVVHKKSLEEFPAGVSIEIASDERKDFRLYIGSDGEWSMRYQMAGHGIGTKPELSRIFEDYLFVTEPTFRDLEPEMQSVRVQDSMEEIAKRLFDRMRGVMDELQ